MIRFWAYLAMAVAMATLFRNFLFLKFVGVIQPDPMHILSSNFQVMFDPKGSRDDKVLGICSNGGCHGNTF